MSIANSGKMIRRPTHPGEIIREEFIPDYNLSARTLAEAIGVSRQTVNELLRERRAISPQMALRLSKFFGNSPEFWLNLQQSIDLWDAENTIQNEIEEIQAFQLA